MEEGEEGEEGEGEDIISDNDGSSSSSNSNNNEDIINKYYAYGIRNSFGLDFDPVTGKLWDTENGPSFGDEINLIEPGFNSGWKDVQGVWKVKGGMEGDVELNPPSDGLADFGGKGKYSASKFIWENVVGPTAIKFLDSDKIGKQYQNDMFVGDFHNGNLYHFDLDQDRSGLVLNGPLNADDGADNDIINKIAASTDKEEEENILPSEALFGKGFGSITDIEVGPDGHLYVVSMGLGEIFRIVPSTA